VKSDLLQHLLQTLPIARKIYGEGSDLGAYFVAHTGCCPRRGDATGAQACAGRGVTESPSLQGEMRSDEHLCFHRAGRDGSEGHCCL